MRINRLLRQGLTVLLSLSLSLGPCAPGSLVTYAESKTESSDTETSSEEEGAVSDTEEESASLEQESKEETEEAPGEKEEEEPEADELPDTQEESEKSDEEGSIVGNDSTEESEGSADHDEVKDQAEAEASASPAVSETRAETDDAEPAGAEEKPAETEAEADEAEADEAEAGSVVEDTLHTIQTDADETVEDPETAEPEKTELHTADPQTYYYDFSDMMSEEYTDDERLYGFLKNYPETGDLLTGALLEAPRDPRYNKLSESEKKIYSKIVNMGAEISAGNRASTVCTITAGELGREGSYDIKDYDTNTGGQPMPMEDLVWAVLEVDCLNIMAALSADVMYELYWSDLRMTYISPMYEYNADQIIISSDAVLEFDFFPNQFYAAGEYSVNTELTKKAARAAGNAKNIVQQAAGKTDYERVVFYKDRIRQLSDYNYSAAAGGTIMTDNNPWRIIYVFDGDPSTKVVCEGYCQAFKYLCDITDFRDSNVVCRIAYGTLYANSTGGHAWNIITMDDGKNYMADVTNCRSARVFLNGYISGNPNDGYCFRAGSSTWKYVYYPKYKTGVLTGMEMFSDDELVLSSTDYTPITFIPVTGISLTKTSITLTEGGKTSISAVVVPANATDRNVDWVSSNSAVAEVDREGRITGKKPGTAVISGVTVSGKYKADCTVTVVSSAKLQAFIKRLYTTCLGRSADAGGLKYWCGRAQSGDLSGIGLAGAFVFSSEFTAKNYCDEHFVNQLYPAMMGRAADGSGLSYWAGRLGSGTKREQLVNEFAFTTEYKQLCTEAGIEPGAKIKVPEYGVQPYGPCSVCGKKTRVVQFVERAYRECMGREADTGGLRYWSKSLCDHTATGKSLVRYFVLSSEMKGKNLSNQEYIKVVYRVMLGREADSGGLNYWKSQIENGKKIEDIIDGFVDSTEFKGICSEYGIQRK